jgi:predicted metal-dependent enzyme (double-stranded beta helix superfamily)/predicted RNA methylase
MRAPAGLLAALASLTLVGCASPARELRPLSKTTARYVAYLDSPARAAWQKPDEVVAALRLKGGETVTDLGAGTGYFALGLAAAVGRSGRVDAADVDPELLAVLGRKLDAEHVANVLPRRIGVDDPALVAQTIDLVFICNTYHHLRERVAYLESLARGLKADGRVAVVDFHKREDIPEGPPFAEKIAREAVLEEFRAAGFELEREESFLPYQYFLVFHHAPSYSFAALARTLTEVMRSPAAARDKQWQVAGLLSDYLRQRRLEPRFQRPNPGLPVTTYLLYDDPQGLFSIAALVFQPHAHTTIHDHQSWVVWGTYSGAERETRYRRHDVPGESFPKLEPAWSRVFAAGDVSFIAPPPDDIHDVENASDAISVSLHVHATDIAKQARNSYDPKQRVVRSFVQSYEPP